MEKLENYQLLDNAIDIFCVLKSFQQNRQTLKLSPANSDKVFSTIILNCDESEGEFIVDEAIGGKELLKPKHNTKYNLEGVLEGIHYKFLGCYWLGSSILQSTKGEPVKNSHRFQFPSLIHHQQRRQSFRTAVPRSIDSRIDVRNQNNDHCFSARILDISVTGLACETILEPASSQFIELDQLKDQSLSLNIFIAKVIDTKCIGKLKDPLPAFRQGQYRFGLEFFPLDSGNERLISKAVVDLQRLTRKNQTR